MTLPICASIGNVRREQSCPGAACILERSCPVSQTVSHQLDSSEIIAASTLAWIQREGLAQIRIAGPPIDLHPQQYHLRSESRYPVWRLGRVNGGDGGKTNST